MILITTHADINWVQWLFKLNELLGHTPAAAVRESVPLMRIDGWKNINCIDVRTADLLIWDRAMNGDRCTWITALASPRMYRFWIQGCSPTTCKGNGWDGNGNLQILSPIVISPLIQLLPCPASDGYICGLLNGLIFFIYTWPWLFLAPGFSPLWKSKTAGFKDSKGGGSHINWKGRRRRRRSQLWTAKNAQDSPLSSTENGLVSFQKSAEVRPMDLVTTEIWGMAGVSETKQKRQSKGK